MKILLIVILLSTMIAAQNRYRVQPGVKGNQIILELSNISETETVEIKSLPNLSKGGAKERIIFTDSNERTITIRAGEEKEIDYNFDVSYNIGETKADTIEFQITDNKTINLTKQFILEYSLPTEYKLEQNFPNPFNPTTKIRYTIPGNVERRHGVSLRIYDILGNEVAALVNEEKPAGYYEIEFNGAELSSGVYFYRLQSGNFTQTKKMVLIR